MLYKSSVLAFLLAADVSAGCPFSSKMVTEMTESEVAACPHDLMKQEPAHTIKGCTCKTQCGASIEEDNFNCDWCYTQNDCGSFGLKGSWDFCDYSPVASYESKSWSTKLDGLWSAVQSDQNSGTYPLITGIAAESIQTTFDDFSDVMPVGREKYIHSVGAVCKFSMSIASNSPFTGLFKAGASVHGLVRLGSALPVDKRSGVVPGIGVKFLRSGVASGNFVSLNTLDPLPDGEYNFFAKNLSNHIPAATSVAAKILVQKFIQASTCATQVGLSDICRYTIDGQAVSNANIKFPYKLVLDSGNINTPSTPSTQDVLQANMIKAMTPGSTLFKVTAFTSPTAEMVLGNMVIDEKCVNSAFGDGSLFFRHQLIENDWALRNDFYQAANAHDCGPVSKISVTPPQPQCQVTH